MLLIDGDDGTREQHAQSLRTAGFHVIAVSDAHGAIELAFASHVDVVVTDATPRGAIDGIEVTTRRLRQHHGATHLPVVMLTAADDNDGRARARAVGCDAIFDKQCESEALASEIRRLVKRSSQTSDTRGRRSIRSRDRRQQMIKPAFAFFTVALTVVMTVVWRNVRAIVRDTRDLRRHLLPPDSSRRHEHRYGS